MRAFNNTLGLWVVRTAYHMFDTKTTIYSPRHQTSNRVTVKYIFLKRILMVMSKYKAITSGTQDKMNLMTKIIGICPMKTKQQMTSTMNWTKKKMLIPVTQTRTILMKMTNNMNNQNLTMNTQNLMKMTQ